MDLEQYLSKKTRIYDIPVSELIPYQNNPRLNDEAVPALVESIKQFGFKVPLVVGSDMVIAAGHTRLKAAKRLNMDTVPCIMADDLTPEQINAFRLADNKVGEAAQWDDRKLLEELQKIAAADYPVEMTDFGFDDLETMLQRLAEGDTTSLADLAEDDDEVDLNALLDEAPRIKCGEVWTIGRHRLMCGDSTCKNDVKKLMGGKEASLLITDPPYGVSYEGATEDRMTIENDDLTGTEFINFLQSAFIAADDSMAPGAAFYIWHADSKSWEFRNALRQTGWEVRQCLIWVKNTLVLGRQDYQWKHEPCLYGWKGGAAHEWHNDRSQTTVLQYDKPQRNDIHPTMKPVPLFEYQIRNSSSIGAAVLDLFAGSGTTGVACERCGRTAYMMELDPQYAEAAMKRLEKITGETAVCAESA